MKQISLTGIKPTGQIHLGNYMGAIKPALALAEEETIQSAYFIADYHALTSVHNAEAFKQHSYGVGAAWLALGLDPEKSIFYRQSDVPEIFELNWILSCFASKGLMNRAHAYKAITDSNLEQNKEIDFGVNMGVFNYPILMAADILMLKADIVPVGKDQIQHIEIARDLAGFFNKTYGETFTLPQFKVQESTAVLPGLDGRKMSKSYNNTIPLFEEPAKLQKYIKKITTDSLPPEAPKNPDTSTIFTLYQAFATTEETADMRTRFETGIGYGEAKNELFYVMNRFLEEPRKKYNELMAHPEKIDAILAKGAAKTREITIPYLKEIKQKIGFPM